MSNSNIYSKGKLVFPTDEGDHDTLSDWWYLTSHFKTKTGRKYSYTVAYLGLNPAYYNRQTSITDETDKTYFNQLKGGPCKSKKGHLNITYSNSDGDHDYWREQADKPFNYKLYTEINDQYIFDVNLSTTKFPLVHGDGLIQMGIGGSSYYYSQTNLTLNGTFTHNGIVESVNGIAWIDRQWGDWTRNYAGWEWFALQLDDNTEIMLYLFYDFKTEKRINCALSIMFADGTSTSLFSEKDFKLQPLGFLEWKPEKSLKQLLLGGLFFKRYFSCAWRLKVPKYKIDITIIPTLNEQRVESLWEGSCYVKGTHNNAVVKAIGTVELTFFFGEPYALRLVKDKFLNFYQRALKRDIWVK